MERTTRTVWLLVCTLVIGGILGSVAALHISAAQAAGSDQGTASSAGKERIVPLRELLPPMRTQGLDILDPVARAVIGGVIWNDPLQMRGQVEGAYALWDTGGSYDLFEGYLGIDDTFDLQSETVVFTADGQRLGSVTLHAHDKARFVAFPLNHCRALQVSLGGGTWRLGQTSATWVVFADARLVAGRTKPAQPVDLFVDDGETRYLEQPGDYRFHVRGSQP